MPAEQLHLWGASDAYERYMGRWSRRVAPLFLNWLDVPPGGRWIDIGCGTGVLTSAVITTCQPSVVVGIDPSEAFLKAAREKLTDPRAALKPGDALTIPEGDGTFDVAVSGLVLNFLSDPELAMREMVRVVRPGGRVALYVWDYSGHMQMMRTFFDAATALDPGASQYDDGVKAPICRPERLRELLARSGLSNVQVQALDIPTAFDNFDDYWTPFLGGAGSAPKYCMSLGEEAQSRLRDEVRGRLPTGPDGEILMAARAWAARGRVED